MSANRTKVTIQKTVTMKFQDRDTMDLIVLEDFIAEARTQGHTTIKIECNAGYPGNQMDHTPPNGKFVSGE